MSCTISVYEIDNIEASESWESAWKVTKESYGVDAVCKQVISTEQPAEDVEADMKEATSRVNQMNKLLKEEVELGATHAFVSSTGNGSPIFGINLSELA